MNKRRVIVWFRNDLRIHDNEALYEALCSGSEIYPVYVFDTRVMLGETHFGLRKTGRFRAQFILDAISDLRSSLRDLGSDLIIRSGVPEDELFALAKQLRTSWVFCNRERTDEELKVQDNLERCLWEVGQEVRYSRGKMLYYTSDLPFPITHTPDVFTQFRKEVEKIVPIRKPLPRPTQLEKFSESLDLGELPSMAAWGFSDSEIVQVSKTSFRGGETSGLKRLKYYLWGSDNITNFKDNRQQLLGDDSSTRMSLYLAHGCLSPKMIYDQLMTFEDTKGRNDSTHELFLALLWRDFYRLMGKKHGNAIFKTGGIKREARKEASEDYHLFRIWCEGRTGLPFIDAAMRELDKTGYMTNRSRRNTASFLINNLNISWQMGAEYFESLLIDYDPCSNYGNWNYIAGIGNDPREGKCMNTLTQAKRYDPDGSYVKYWIPALKDIPSDKVHQPFLLDEEAQCQYNCVLQKDYPSLCINKDQYE